ncbi:MAG: hypothetical protein AB1744_13085, partial [Candidatus Zixiibacteriota bacterium]
MKELTCYVSIALLAACPLIAVATPKNPTQGFAVTDNTSYNAPICVSKHDVGRFVLAVYNHGVFGVAPFPLIAQFPDCITGEVILYGSEFPKRSRRNYLWASGIWIGGILSDDTLVTTAVGIEPEAENRPDWTNGKAMGGR